MLCVCVLTNHSQERPKGTLSITTTPRCKGECYYFPWITPLNRDHTLVFGMTQPGIEPQSPGPLVNTLTTMAMDQLFTYQ